MDQLGSTYLISSGGYDRQVRRMRQRYRRRRDALLRRVATVPGVEALGINGGLYVVRRVPDPPAALDACQRRGVAVVPLDTGDVPGIVVGYAAPASQAFPAALDALAAALAEQSVTSRS